MATDTEIERSPSGLVAGASGRDRPARLAAAWRFRLRYIAEKIASAIFVLWAAVTLSFFSVHLAPGDPVLLLMGEVETPQLRAAIEEQWGLDKPLFDQYATYVARIAQGDFGYSFVQNTSVNSILFGQRAIASAQLTGFAIVLALLISATVAVLTAARRGIVYKGIQLTELVLASVPSFWLGIVLIIVLSFQLGWLPVTSGTVLQKLVLPGLTLALPLAAVLSQVIREGIERSLEQPYAITALARGISNTQLKYRHALRHSILPATTLVGWSVGGMLTGTVIVEQVFGRTGIGQATVFAVTVQDIPVVLAVALIAAAIYVAVNTIVDILYLWIDPRIRAE
jgi:peptide/nickel transport system permease protein